MNEMTEVVVDYEKAALIIHKLEVGIPENMLSLNLDIDWIKQAF